MPLPGAAVRGTWRPRRRVLRIGPISTRSPIASIYLREAIHPPFRIVCRLDDGRVRVVRVWRSERQLSYPDTCATTAGPNWEESWMIVSPVRAPKGALT
jgi:hypothetical protein